MDGVDTVGQDSWYSIVFPVAGVLRGHRAFPH
jgi:hypothetical protein